MNRATSLPGIARSSGRRVRLLAAPRRTPRTSLESLVCSTMERDRTMPFEALVQRLARALYVDALRHGAWTLDIGVFGAELFVPDVVRELEEGDGTVWQIEPPDRVP